MSNIIVIDGSSGEGGGQILRTSLALSVLTGRSIEIKNIRAKRSKPGLLRQHLTGLRAAKQISNASVQGDQMGSQRVIFEPGAVAAGAHHFDVGTAGSTCLVLQTILYPLLFADKTSKISISGGTHALYAPTPEFLNQVFLPHLTKMGAHIELTCPEAGFYPAGGGKIEANIEPMGKNGLQKFELFERGDLNRQTAKMVVANLSRRIAERELEALEKYFHFQNEGDARIEEWKSRGPGNMLYLQQEYEHCSELFIGIGTKGKTAERVAQELVQQAQKYMASGAPVGEYLADQLLLPMALGDGGSFICTAPSQHTLTQAQMIQKFLPVSIQIQKTDQEQWRIDVEV